MNKDQEKALSVWESHSHFVSVNGSQLHYVEMGSGDPILFLHGIPTSSYVWRHMLPQLSLMGRCIAPDLIGMGKSGKPDIVYTIEDHIAYIEAFITTLGLKKITLVLHGWGSVIGLDYASRHEDNIKAVALYESHLRPVQGWDQLSLPVQQLASLLNRPGASYRAVVKQNYFVEKLLPRSVIRDLTEEEMSEYRKPFLTEASRKPLWQYVNELPLGRGSSSAEKIISAYSHWLEKTTIPKLLIYAVPGFMTTIDDVTWARDHLSALSMAALDDALHLAQESVPEQFSMAFTNWYQTL